MLEWGSVSKKWTIPKNFIIDDPIFQLMLNKLPLLLLTGLLFLLPACELEDIPNPNGPTLEALTDGATLEDLRLLAAGVESVQRNDIQFYYWTTSIIGREYYDLRGTDPRYTGELLGAQGAQLDNNGFLTTRTFAAAYRAVRHTYVLEEAVKNTAASLTGAERAGFTGFAKFIRAYNLLLVANHQFENGIRLDVSDPDNLGGFTGGYQESLTGIRGILDQAISDLNGAGDAFAFALSPNFLTGIDAGPAGLAQVANAIAARVAIYQNDKGAARGYLDNSFLDLDGDLNAGAYYSFGSSGNDLFNPIFNVPCNQFYVAQNDFVESAEDGDARLADKLTDISTCGGDIGDEVALDDLSGEFQVTIYDSNVSPIPIIRNAELILLYAEANIGDDDDEAESALNIIRTAAGLEEVDLNGEAELENELLRQRRYELFGEGHRWIDLRRFDRLDDIMLDRPGDIIHVQFPRPVTENE